MPMKICLGYPGRSKLTPEVLTLWRQLDPLVDGRLGDEASILLRLDIPTLWGSALLDWVASSLALGRGLPPAFDPDRDLDVDLAEEYVSKFENEEVEERFPHLLLHGYEGLFLPVDPMRIHHSEDGPCPIGSSAGLLQDVTAVLATLGAEPVENVSALVHTWSAARGAGASRAIETHVAQVHALAARLSVDSCIPLFYERSYPLKPADDPVSYASSAYRGFDTFQMAEVEPGGNTLRVALDSGYVYRIPFAYLKLWRDDLSSASSYEYVAVSDFPLVLEIQAGGKSFTVDSDTLLSWCEPSYEGFGRAHDTEVDVLQGYRSYAPLRIYPRSD